MQDKNELIKMFLGYIHWALDYESTLFQTRAAHVSIPSKISSISYLDILILT